MELTEKTSTGRNDLDEILYGILIPNFGLQFLKQPTSRNNRSVLYTFEESREPILNRSGMVNIPIEEMIEIGRLNIVSVEPLSYSPDEFSKMVCTDIEENDTRMVMLDFIGGCSLAIREENILERLHSLTVYLQNITGNFKATNKNASYLVDNIMLLRYLEVNGELRKAIGVLKKRLSDFEKFIRECKITLDGIVVGPQLNNISGILNGNIRITE